MSLQTMEYKSGHCGGKHSRKKIRKNVTVGRMNNCIETNEEDVAGKKQQMTMLYIVSQQKLGYRRSSKRPPPKPKRLYLEREWSLSPSPPHTPDLEPVPVPLPPSCPLIPSKPLKNKRLPQPFQNSKKKRSTSVGKEDHQQGMDGTGEQGRQLPKPLPRKSSDIDIAELKRKLQILNTTSNLSIDVMVKRKSIPKSPPSYQRAFQAKMQPLLPPTAKPRKPAQAAEAFPSLSSIGTVGEERGKEMGRRREEGRGSGSSSESDKNKPPLNSPLPRPRAKGPLVALATSPTRPLPTPKTRPENREKDRSSLQQDKDEDVSTSPPARPIPSARSVSKGDRELVQQSRTDQELERGRRPAGKTAVTVPSVSKGDRELVQQSRNNQELERGRRQAGKTAVTVPSKGPVPRKRVSKDNLVLTPAANMQSTSSSARNLSPASPASLNFSPSPKKTNFDGRSSTTKRKKGGSIRQPLWNPPPPPTSSPPCNPARRISRKSPKHAPPSLALVAARPTSHTYAIPTFTLPPFQKSPLPVTSLRTDPASHVYDLPIPVKDRNNRPIQLAKPSVSPSRRSMDKEFENLYENRSIKKKRRVPGGQNGLPLTLMQELQLNLQMQSKR